MQWPTRKTLYNEYLKAAELIDLGLKEGPYTSVGIGDVYTLRELDFIFGLWEFDDKKTKYRGPAPMDLPRDVKVMVLLFAAQIALTGDAR